MTFVSKLHQTNSDMFVTMCVVAKEEAVLYKPFQIHLLLHFGSNTEGELLTLYSAVQEQMSQVFQP